VLDTFRGRTHTRSREEHMLRRFRGWLIVAGALAVLVVLGRVACRPRPIEVETAGAAYGPVEDLVTNSEAGSVRSHAQARVGAERAGRVAAIHRREGAAVRAGEALVELDASTAERRLEATRRDLEAARSARDAARAAAVLARQSHERLESLRKDQLVSAEQMDEARSRRDGAEAELAAAGARVASAEAAVRLAEDEIAHLTVRAPFAGVVTRRLVEVGESVIPGQPLLEVTSPERLYVSAPIDERDAGRLRTGLPVRITVDTYAGDVWEGRVTRLAPIVEEAREQNRTLEIEADFPADTSRPHPRPGMTADVEIVLSRRDRVLRIPTSALMENGRVYVVESGRAVIRTVEPGLRNWDWTEIHSGLAEGAQVVTSLDRQGLKAGAAVASKRAAADAGAARAGTADTAR
jgi:HlyD family secretion protein